ncbi:MAG: ferredoxin-type protein NapF [Sulfurospirillaceae bacterium]|jgi:ferredoxin-type protein NapF|nr:ferredoxin-type protein NapF [Sulfurospirillaceae bacterium]MDD2826565.1 ferredoxin-type protein NapF [Sulfurospirillaceae bacterium]
MASNTRREAFASLSSFFGPKTQKALKTLVRPPYHSDERLLMQICPTCSDAPCLASCPEEIIALDDGKIPYIVFTQSGCTFCEECAKACPHDVLALSFTSQAKISANFKIDTVQCMAWNQTICQSCADACDAKAITFFGMLRPLIEMKKCTGCGMCYSPCPTNAIVFSAQHTVKEK